MKKLFFLCAFLLMSMQIQAQLYIVETHASFTGFGYEYATAVVIYEPNALQPTIVEVDIEIGINASNDEDRSNAWLTLNQVLNGIISDGYQLMPAFSYGWDTNENDPSPTTWGGRVYFLSAP